MGCSILQRCRESAYATIAGGTSDSLSRVAGKRTQVFHQRLPIGRAGGIVKLADRADFVNLSEGSLQPPGNNFASERRRLLAFRGRDAIDLVQHDQNLAYLGGHCFDEVQFFAGNGVVGADDLQNRGVNLR